MAIDENLKVDNWFSYSLFLDSFVQKESNGIYFLSPEIMEWLCETVEYPIETEGFDEEGFSLGFGLYFEKNEDATLFRLTWCNDKDK